MILETEIPKYKELRMDWLNPGTIFFKDSLDLKNQDAYIALSYNAMQGCANCIANAIHLSNGELDLIPGNTIVKAVKKNYKVKIPQTALITTLKEYQEMYK